MRYSKPIFFVFTYSSKRGPPIIFSNCIQAGHWKSVNTVIWTFAFLFPKNGLSIFLSKNTEGSFVNISVFEEQEVRKNQEMPITAKIDILCIIKSVLGDICAYR